MNHPRTLEERLADSRRWGEVVAQRKESRWSTYPITVRLSFEEYDRILKALEAGK